MNEKDKMLLRLQDVLREKRFPEEVNRKIKFVMKDAFLDENKEVFDEIIEGLKCVDTFEIGTRKHFLKLGIVQGKLPKDAFGFVTNQKELVAIVRGKNEKATIFHELIHVSQPTDAYHIDAGIYPFASLFEKALKEGEAIVREIEYSNSQMTSLGKESLHLPLHSRTYQIFRELYEDMEALVGKTMMKKWKQNDGKTDFLPTMDQYVEKEKNTKFRVIYQWWGLLLYRFMKEDKDYQQMAETAFSTMQQLRESNLQEMIAEEAKLESIKQEKQIRHQELQQYEKLLASKDDMQQKYDEIIKEQQQAIEETKQSKASEKIIQNMQEELAKATFPKYEKVVREAYVSTMEDLKTRKQEEMVIEKKKQSFAMIQDFFPTKEAELFAVEEIASVKNMLFHVLLHPTEEIPTIFFRSTQLYAPMLERNKIAIQK